MEQAGPTKGAPAALYLPFIRKRTTFTRILCRIHSSPRRELLILIHSLIRALCSLFQLLSTHFSHRGGLRTARRLRHGYLDRCKAGCQGVGAAAGQQPSTAEAGACRSAA